MAVDGWSSEGTPRLICANPPGGSGSFIPSRDSNIVGDSCSFYPNAMVGIARPNIVPSFNTTSDFSIEIWARWKWTGTSPGSSSSFGRSGISTATGNVNAGEAEILWREDGTTEAVMRNFQSGDDRRLTMTAPQREGLWHHYAVNFDRDANMAAFIDGIASGTLDISVHDGRTFDSIINPYWHQNVKGPTTEVAAWSTIHSLPVVAGQFALHTRLLTLAEIHNSFRTKGVQNISGASYMVYDWSRVIGEVGWDCDWDRMGQAMKMALPIPAASPFGVDGTVTVPDLSGNGNDVPVRTSLDYTNFTNPYHQADVDNMWPVVFGADPFFR